MRLEFNILWIEDQPQHVRAQHQRITRIIRKEGFRLRSEFARSIDDATEYLKNDIYGDHIDLILMDYDLGAGTRGDQGLIQTRKIFAYKDIVFYSSQANNLEKMVADLKVQGVYCSNRDELPDTVEGVFESLVKKVLDIDHSRGIVMGATSDIDHLINACLTNIHNNREHLRSKAMDIVQDRMKKIRDRFEKGANNVEKLSDISGLENCHNIYTSIDRLNLLRKLLKADGIFLDEELNLKKYAEDTVPQRNNLAHLRVQREGFSRKLIDKHGNELTSEEMKRLRKALLEYQEIFEKLANGLAPDAQ